MATEHIEQCTAEEVIGAVMNTYSNIAERPIYKTMTRVEDSVNSTFAELKKGLGLSDKSEFTPLTTEEITNEINTLWEGL